jgi:hypothetical protein
MRSPSFALCAAAALVFAASCGARSTLRDPGGETAAGSGGTGTATATATATSAATGPGSGPGGGPTLACPGLVTVEPPIEVPISDGTQAARDALLLLLGTGEVLALVRGEALTTPDDLPTTVASIRLEPWTLWPPTIHPPNVVHQLGWKTPFVATVEPQGTFALGVERYPFNNQTGCDLDAVFGISPDVSGTGALNQAVSGTCDDAPLAIATAGDGMHLVANDLNFDGNSPGARRLEPVLLGAKGGLLASLDPYCASKPFVADALSIDGTLFFVHSSATSASCDSTPGPQDVPSQLVLHRFQGQLGSSEALYTGLDDMVDARLLPRPGGGWLVFRESGASALVQPPGMAMPVGQKAGWGAEFPITEAGAGRMAVAALGDGLVVAVVDSLDPSAPTVLLRVYSGAGTLLTESSFSTSGAWLNGDRLSLIASPDGRSFLVGWTGSKSTPGSALFVRRFDCALAL